MRLKISLLKETGAESVGLKTTSSTRTEDLSTKRAAAQRSPMEQ